MAPIKVIIAFVPAALAIVGMIWMAIDIVRHSQWYKTKKGLCWRFHCFQKVTNCQAGPTNNGPMCDEHCALASYHAFFSGCREPYGIPIQDRMRRTLNHHHTIIGEVVNRRGSQKLLN